MNTAATAHPNRIQLTEKTADRIGVATSVLCAIHCALAPALLIFLPTFGKIWAYSAFHALVANIDLYLVSTFQSFRLTTSPRRI